MYHIINGRNGMHSRTVTMPFSRTCGQFATMHWPSHSAAHLGKSTFLPSSKSPRKAPARRRECNHPGARLVAGATLRTLARSAALLPDGPLFLLRGAKLLPAPAWRSWVLWCDVTPPEGISHTPVLPPLGQETATRKPRRPDSSPIPFILQKYLPPQDEWVIRTDRDTFTTLSPLHGRMLAKIGTGLWDIRLPHQLRCGRCPAWHWPWECPSLLPVHGPVPKPPERGRIPTFIIRATYPTDAAHGKDREHPNEQNPKRIRLNHCQGSLTPPRTGGVSGWGRGWDLLTCGDVEANPGRTQDGDRNMSLDVDVDGMVSMLCVGNHVSTKEAPPCWHSYTCHRR